MGRTTAQKRTQREMLDRLAEVGGKLTAEEDVVFQGERFILPAKSTLEEAIRFLTLKYEEDEKTVAFDRVFNYRPWDGARATGHAFRRAFGMMAQQSTMSIFGEKPPQLKTINVSVDETEQVPWGKILVPHLPGLEVYTGGTTHPEMGPLFQMAAQGPRKYRHHVEGIFRLVEDELKQNSLYRGKAFDGQTMPQFLDLRGVDENKVIYSSDVTTQLDANIWSLLKYTDRMRALGVPLKRAVLFEGPYGTGKTLGAYLTAQVAIENGWTFIYCRPAKDDIKEVLATARLYQPAVVFFEDVDSIASVEGQSSDRVSTLLDLFDGVQSKGTEIICVLTTNHVESIQKAMVRPGRLDAVIHIGALDIHGAERMAKAVIPSELVDPETNWLAVGKAMEGFLPSFTREALDRALRYTLARNEGEPALLSTPDFVAAAEGLRPQLELMENAQDATRPDTLGEALTRTTREAVDGTKIRDVDNDEFGHLEWTDDNKDAA